MAVRYKPQKTGETCCDDSGTHDGVDGNKARQAYFSRDLCVTQVPLRVWAGREDLVLSGLSHQLRSRARNRPQETIGR